jgi:serine/threonine-protein kinase
MTLLEKEPDARFPSAGALVAALSGDTSMLPAPKGTTYGGQEPGRAGAAWADLEPPHGSGSGPRYPGTGAAVGRPLGALGGTPADYEPTAQDIERWEAEPVRTFRRKFIYYAVVNAAIVLMSIFTGVDLMFVPVIWTIYMAVQYAGLWTSNYDWRDVARQPQDRQLVDVAAETIEDVRGMFDEQKRETSRQRRRSRSMSIGGMVAPGLGGAIMIGGGAPAGGAGLPPVRANAASYGPYAQTVQQAEADRGEILRLVNALPSRDRDMIANAIDTASQLCNQVRSLAVSLLEHDRSGTPGAAAALDAEIADLEARANPLERESDDRVRRLAKLRRERRALAERERRRAETAAKLESCSLALGDLKLTVLKLRAGGVQPHVGQITTLTERARVLAQEVDLLVAAADEVNAIVGPTGAGRTTQGAGRSRSRP